MNRDALDRVREAGGDALAERLLALDAARARAREGVKDRELDAPDRGASVDTDVVIAGGGLSILVAAALAARGVRVMVVERARAGAAHREWNASRPELDALKCLFSSAEIEELIVAKYTRGMCKFHGGTRHMVRGVLDHAVDAGELLSRTRALAEARGVRFVDRASVEAVGAGEDAVRIRARDDAGMREIVASLLVDARGASSPYASADLMCPTVGGVVRGLEEGEDEAAIDPTLGEILVTNEPLEATSLGPRQHLWEAFPGRPGEVTIYAFYYARAQDAGSLVELYARFFRTLPMYKRGEAKLARPTFGFIPGWSRLAPSPRSPHPRIVLVGDAAARHSPLTFCGFGAMLRSFAPAADALARAINEKALPETDRGALAHDTPVHALTGGLARLMASSRMQGNAMNGLLDAAFGTLASMGNEAYASLLRDEMDARAFVAFLRTTAKKHPQVYSYVMKGLGLGATGRWGMRVAREVAFAR